MSVDSPSKLKSGNRFLNAVVLGHSAKLLTPALVSDQSLWYSFYYCPMRPCLLSHVLLPPENRHFPAPSSLLLPTLLFLSVAAISFFVMHHVRLNSIMEINLIQSCGHASVLPHYGSYQWLCVHA